MPRALAKRKAQSWKLSARSEPRGRTGRPSDEKRRLAGVPLGGDTPPRGDASSVPEAEPSRAVVVELLKVSF